MSSEMVKAVGDWHGVPAPLLAAIAAVEAQTATPERGRAGLRMEGDRVRRAEARGDADEAEFQAFDQVARELVAHIRRVRDLAPALEDAEAEAVAVAAYDCGDVAEAVRAHLRGREPRGARTGYAAQVVARAAALRAQPARPAREP